MDNNQPPDNGDEEIPISWSALSDLIEQATLAGADDHGSQTMAEDSVAPSGTTTKTGGSGPFSEPQEVKTEYLRRTERVYQVTALEFRNSRYAQAFTALFAAIGTFLFSFYLDYQKDLELTGFLVGESEKIVHPFVENTMNFLFWGSWLFWFLALAAWIIQGTEIRHIKEIHGEFSWWRLLWIHYVVRKIPKS